MRKRIILISSFLIFQSFYIYADQFFWTKKTDMPTGRHYLSAVAVNGKLYAIGGYKDPKGGDELDSIADTVEEYDPETDAWTSKTNMPTARAMLAAAVVNDKIYVIGGYLGVDNQGISTVEEYNPQTNSWAIKADMPTARHNLGVAVVNNKIYAIGGTKNGLVQKAVEVYNVATDSWTAKANLPEELAWFGTGVVDDKIYVIGGLDWGYHNDVATVYEYDVENDTWTQKTSMPTARGRLVCNVIDKKIYSIGGKDRETNSYACDEVEIYDPSDDSWTTGTNMPTKTYGMAGGVVDDKIYIIGGRGEKFYSPIVEEWGYETTVRYDPDEDSSIVIQFEFATIIIEIPAGAFNESGTLDISASYLPEADNDDIELTDLFLDIFSSLQPNADITLTIYYSDAWWGTVENSDKKKLMLVRYDNDTSRWIPLDSTIDEEQNTITAKTKHFSTFAVAQYASSDNLDNFGGKSVYPNPYKPSEHANGMVFTALTADAEIKIYSVTGELIRELTYHNGDGRIIWYGKNDAGENVASGVYIAYVKGAESSKKVKVAIIR